MGLAWKKFRKELKILSSRRRVQRILSSRRRVQRIKPSLEKIKAYARGWRLVTTSYSIALDFVFSLKSAAKHFVNSLKNAAYIL